MATLFASPKRLEMQRLAEWMSRERRAPSLTDIQKRFRWTTPKTIVVVTRMVEAGLLVPLASILRVER